jgi:hypothetical protein
MEPAPLPDFSDAIELLAADNKPPAHHHCGAVHPDHPDLVCRMSRGHDGDHWCAGLGWDADNKESP